MAHTKELLKEYRDLKTERAGDGVLHQRIPAPVAGSGMAAAGAPRRDPAASPRRRCRASGRESGARASAAATPRTRAMDGLRLRGRREEFLAIVGPSGCGKSTLMRLIAGLLTPDQGADHDQRPPGRTGPYTELGIVFQKPILLDWRTVLGNVMLQVELRGLKPPTISLAPASCWTRSVSPSSRTAILTSSPAACSSARRSARAAARPAAAADGRAVRRARRADPRAAPDRPRGALACDPQDGACSLPTASTRRCCWPTGCW